jgi:hypothetical protein
MVVGVPDPKTIELTPVQTRKSSRLEAVDDPLFGLRRNQLAEGKDAGDIPVLLVEQLIDEPARERRVAANDSRRRITDGALRIPGTGKILEGGFAQEIGHGRITFSRSVMEEFHEHVPGTVWRPGQAAGESPPGMPVQRQIRTG